MVSKKKTTTVFDVVYICKMKTAEVFAGNMKTNHKQRKYVKKYHRQFSH